MSSVCYIWVGMHRERQGHTSHVHSCALRVSSEAKQMLLRVCSPNFRKMSLCVKTKQAKFSSNNENWQSRMLITIDEQRSVLALLFLLWQRLSVIGAAKKGLKCDLSGKFFEILDTGMNWCCPSTQTSKRLILTCQVPCVNSPKGNKWLENFLSCYRQCRNGRIWSW